MSSEAKELELLGKVEFRIALADSDSKLENLLKTYLAPVLLKLASEHLSVRNKVISICGHVNTRISPHSIRLPVAALLKQFKEHSTPLIRHFDSVYIQQGVSRLPEGELLKLLPDLISGVAEIVNIETLQGAQLFQVLLRILNFYSLPPRGTKEDTELRNVLAVSDKDAAFLAFWFGKLVLFTLPPRTPAPTTGSSQEISRPGLTPAEYKFLSLHGSDSAWDKAQGGLKLEDVKVTAAKLLVSGLFNDEERFLPAVYASASSGSRISEIGEDMLKRVSLDLDRLDVITKIYDVYLCVGSAKGCTPLLPPIRTRLLTWLAKSSASASFPERVISIVKGELGVADFGPSLVLSQRGLESSKLHTALLTFVQSLVQKSKSSELEVVAKELIEPLQHYIENQGWPVADADQDVSSRGHCYEIIGLLAKAAKQPNIELLSWLFKSLEQDTSGNIMLSIDEALSHTIDIFRNLSGRTQDRFEKLLSRSLDSQKLKVSAENSRQVRMGFAAVRFANRCLPFSNIRARRLDTVAIGLNGVKDSQDIIAEGRRGLAPHSFDFGNTTKELEFPRFDRLLYGLMFFEDDEDSFDFGGGEESIDNLNTEYALSMIDKFAKSRPHQFAAAVQFLRLILYHESVEAQQRPLSDSDWDRKVSALITNESARLSIKSTIKQKTTASSLSLLLHSAFRLSNMETGEDSSFFIELYSLTGDIIPNTSIPGYMKDLEEPIFSNNPFTRSISARAAGIIVSLAVSSGLNVLPFVERCLQRISGWEGAAGAGVNQIHGAVLTLAHFFSKLSLRGLFSESWESIYLKFLNPVLLMLKVTDKTLKEASYVALGQLSMYYVLKPSLLQANVANTDATYTNTADLIYESSKSGDEKAITALGRFGEIVEEESDELKHVIDRLHSLHETKRMESQFAVGEALSCVACGWSSKAFASELDIDMPLPSGPERKSTLGRIVDKTIEDCRASKPSLRKASVIWLLCLLDFCGHKPELHDRLPQCQVAFKSCLADKDELVQEAASRGLGLVYEKGDQELKDTLVRDLVASFSDNKSQLVGTVTDDTQLFESGALPTGEGSSITTYKDILSLASEVGDSSLVYRFMSMASSSAIWSSRAAFGRFGLTNVFADAKIDNKLIVKLFRYRFDPNSNVRRAMNQIWIAVVKDPTSAIENNFDQILEDLLKSVVDGREWRTREASCAALADLVQGQRFEKYEAYLDRIWTQCFKVMDDIKGSVRLAAFSLARVLTGILTRSLEADSGSSKNAEGLLKRVIPFLLSGSGIESSAKEVQGFAIITLLDIIKKSGAKTLRPFIPELIERLIALHSSLEPEAVNYLHLNASKYNTTEMEIDDQRLKMVRMSPISEAIERCLDRLDDQTMTETAPRLEQAMKTALGLPSKVGCSRVLVSLSTRHNLTFRPFADRFLQLIEKLILDRNDTVSSSYAAAGGYVARLASDKQLLRTATFARQLYFQSEDTRSRIITGDLVYSISKHATDRFNSLGLEFLPFVFVAKQDSDEQARESFEKTWSENVGGSRSVMLYLKEIVALAQQFLDSPKWALKHTSARAIAEATTSTASTIEDITISNAEILWPALEKAMSGKTWEGKEVVLKAFVRFVERGSHLWKAKSAVATDIKKIAVREAKRQNKEYRPFAVRALGQIAAARTDIDLSDTVFEVLEPAVDEFSGEDAMEVDGEPGAKRDKLIEETMVAVILTAADAVQPKALHESNRIVDNLIDISKTTESALKIIARAEENTGPFKPSIRTAIFEAYKALFTRLQEPTKSASSLPSTDDDSLTKVISKTLFNPSDGRLSESIRLKRAEAIVSLAKIGWRTVAEGVLTEWLAKESELEKSPVVRGELEKARAELRRI